MVRISYKYIKFTKKQLYTANEELMQGGLEDGKNQKNQENTLK